MKKKIESTIERWEREMGYNAKDDPEYKEFVISELILAIMADDEKTVRSLAKEAGLSKDAIQNLRSGKSNGADMRLKNFLSIVSAYGYEVILKKGNTQIPMTSPNPQ